jgi:hypothetical protein
MEDTNSGYGQILLRILSDRWRANQGLNEGMKWEILLKSERKFCRHIDIYWNFGSTGIFMICTLPGISRKMNSRTMRGGAGSTKWNMGNSYRIIAVWR